MNNKYYNNLLNKTKELNKYNVDCDLILSCVKEIKNEIDNINIKQIISCLSKYIDLSKDKNVIKLCKEIEQALIEYIGYEKLKQMYNAEDKSVDNSTLEELLDKLDNLVGLLEVKEKVKDLIDYHKIRNMRSKNGLKLNYTTLHMAFTGNPGTGKTTVARIIGHLYKKLGLLSSGHFIEVSRTDLIAGYQGQTALKVKKVIDSAIGGVLFIDEAYSITENDKSDSYGRECLTELTKALEDYRTNLVVIVAGYTEPMKKFFMSNPGLKSRFNTFIEFKDYNKDELMKILVKCCNEDDYKLTDEAYKKISSAIEEIPKTDNFSNGRYVRNMYEKMLMNQAKRLCNKKTISKEDLILLTEDDFRDLDLQNNKE